MTVRICGAATMEPGRDPMPNSSVSAPSGAEPEAFGQGGSGDACRHILYADLALAEPPPAERFEFYDLCQSWPARIRLAVEIESRIRRAGGEIINAPSTLAQVETPLELARLLTPDLAIHSAMDPDVELPCRLRAAFGGNCQESNWLESRGEYDETLLDWILSGTDPKLIFRVSSPNHPPKLLRGVRAEGRLFLAAPLDESASASLREQLDACGRQLAVFDFWIEDGRPRLWRVDDSWAVMAGTPAVLRG